MLALLHTLLLNDEEEVPMLACMSLMIAVTCIAVQAL
jgi:hypothetical protein